MKLEAKARLSATVTAGAGDAKYEKMVNKALDHFEKEGFCGPKK